jgi:hypothetical protein
VTKGWVSDAPDARHSNVWFWPIPGAAAAVELLVAGAVVALLVVTVLIAPAPVVVEVVAVVVVELALVERPPLAAGVPAVNVGTVVELVAVPPLAVAALVELVAMLSIVAPRPADPAELAPVDELPLPPDVLGGDDTVTVGVLVSVVPEVTVAAEPALAKVWPDVT